MKTVGMATLAEKCRAQAADFEGVEHHLLLRIAEEFERLELTRGRAEQRGPSENEVMCARAYPQR